MTVDGMHIHLERESEKELRIGQKLKQKEGGEDYIFIPITSFTLKQQNIYN